MEGDGNLLQALPLCCSFHEMAMYDLPAMVGFILRETGQEKLFYVGHGQGSSLGEWGGGAEGAVSIPDWTLLEQGCCPHLPSQPFCLGGLCHTLPIHPGLGWHPGAFFCSNPAPQTRSGVWVVISCRFSGFIAFSSLPHLAEKIKLFFALTPMYTFRHARGPVLRVAFLPDHEIKVQEVFVGGYCQNPGTFGNSCPLHCHCARILQLQRVLELPTPLPTSPCALAEIVWKQRAGAGAQEGEDAPG